MRKVVFFSLNDRTATVVKVLQLMNVFKDINVTKLRELAEGYVPVSFFSSWSFFKREKNTHLNGSKRSSNRSFSTFEMIVSKLFSRRPWLVCWELKPPTRHTAWLAWCRIIEVWSPVLWSGQCKVPHQASTDEGMKKLAFFKVKNCSRLRANRSRRTDARPIDKEHCYKRLQAFSDWKISHYDTSHIALWTIFSPASPCLNVYWPSVAFCEKLYHENDRSWAPLPQSSARWMSNLLPFCWN